MREETDTPETDHLENSPLFKHRERSVTCGEALLHARKLEREKNEALRQNEILSKFINSEMRMTADDPRILKLKELLETL